MKKIRLICFYSMILALLCAFGCKKDQLPYKPSPSAFTVEVQNASPIYPVGGADVKVTINAGANGWWIVVPEADMAWCKPARLYGSANQTIVIKLLPNASGFTRKVEVMVNPTFNLEPVKLTFEQAGQ